MLPVILSIILLLSSLIEYHNGYLLPALLLQFYLFIYCGTMDGAWSLPHAKETLYYLLSEYIPSLLLPFKTTAGSHPMDPSQ